MKNKIISILFLLLFFFGNANGQDIRFSYSVATDGATSTVSVFMEKINAGAESVGGLTVDFYYNNAETTLSSWNTAPLTNLGWNVFLTTTNHQADSNPTVPITHTGYGEISVIDQNTVGTALTTASGQVHILDIVFDNAVGTPNFGGDGFLASTSNNRPPLKYTDPSASNQFDVIATGSQAQALPVELVFFEARAFEKHIALSWQSETETAFSGYELQRSTDGARFSKLVFMNAKGDGLAQAYQYQDEDVRPGITYYYRLKMID
ncbi:MAG TPA: hypothetical protein ENJ95_22545, partial [Bacteroidetes bacterium]|nr:hypothetical protein [Bacteroidota bacterium]